MKHRRIALLGGGQLGRMFLENAFRYDVHVEALDPDPNAPCKGLAARLHTGDLHDEDAVLKMAREADVVGLEIEHVSVPALRKLKAMGKLVIPDPEVLHIIQDKGLQKEFYARHGIPTSPFALVDSPEALRGHDGLFPAYLKTRRGGYDGRGVRSIQAAHAVAADQQWPCVLEKKVDVALELAVIVVRDRHGEQICYEPVEMVFDPRYDLVDHLRTPARIDERTKEKAMRLAMKVASAFAETGIYAVEMFLDKDGGLLVNETAPRAHNSGHHTIEACASSQFDQLLRCYMEWPLGDTRSHTPAAMINLVGEQGSGEPQVEGLDRILAMPGTFLHLYGKEQTRTGRKMGHVTVTASTQEQLDEAIGTVRRYCRIVPRPVTAIGSK